MTPAADRSAPRLARRTLAALAVLAALAAQPAQAQSISLAGRMGSKALLVIDGQQQVLDVGQSARGVRLVGLDAQGALVEAGGRRLALREGVPARLDGSGTREVVIPSGPGGHFVVAGAIEGRPVRFMVDTGATLVALSEQEADRLGLAWRGGQAGQSQTAGGVVATHVVVLRSLRVGDVELANVTASVLATPMPGILLGNSALERFSMQREGGTMRLVLR